MEEQILKKINAHLQWGESIDTINDKLNAYFGYQSFKNINEIKPADNHNRARTVLHYFIRFKDDFLNKKDFKLNEKEINYLLKNSNLKFMESHDISILGHYIKEISKNDIFNDEQIDYLINNSDLNHKIILPTFSKAYSPLLIWIMNGKAVTDNRIFSRDHLEKMIDQLEKTEENSLLLICSLDSFYLEKEKPVFDQELFEKVLAKTVITGDLITVLLAQLINYYPILVKRVGKENIKKILSEESIFKNAENDTILNAALIINNNKGTLISAIDKIDDLAIKKMVLNYIIDYAEKTVTSKLKLSDLEQINIIKNKLEIEKK